jgi:hypothetical protein
LGLSISSLERRSQYVDYNLPMGLPLRQCGALLVLGALVACAHGDGPLATIAYRADGTDKRLLTIPVYLNDRGPFWFCVDTGAPQSVIDSRLAEQLHIDVSTSSEIHGTGQGTVTAGHPGPQQLRIGAVRLTVHDPVTLDLSTVPIDRGDRGLVGSELFERYVVTIDPMRRELSIYDPARFRPESTDEVLAMTGDGKRLYVTAKLFVRPGLVVEHSLRIDTGSEDSVNDPIVRESTTTRSTTLGNGLGSNYQGYSGVYDAVALGPFRIEHVWGPGGELPAVGMEVLRRFVITFDAPHHRLYLRPTPALSDPVPVPPA